jgi:hypothetical protein
LRLRGYLSSCVALCLVLSLAGAAGASTRHHHKVVRCGAGKVKKTKRVHGKKRTVCVAKSKQKTAAEPSVLPSMGASPNPSIFGINTLGYVSTTANYNRLLPTAKSMGTHWVHFTNASIKFSSTGQPSWGTLDDQVTEARKLGLGVLISLGGTPTACSVSPRPTDFTECPPTTPADLSAYSTYLRSELVRYRNDVQYWESWLEPNGGTYWRGGANPQQYASLLQTQYAVFQQVNSTYHTDLKLVFGGPISFGTAPGSAGAIAVLPFVNDVLNDLHGARAFDAIGLHAYRFPARSTAPATLNWGPSADEWDYVDGLSFADSDGCAGGALWCQMTWPQELEAYEQVFENHGYGETPLWLTEFGWPGTATPTTALYPSFATQAEYLSEAYTDLLRLPFVQAAFVFNLEDYTPGLVSPDPAFFYHYGLLQYGFAPKPAANTYEQFVRNNPGR